MTALNKASFEAAGVNKMVTWDNIRSCQDERCCLAAIVPSIAEASPVELHTLLLLDAVL